MKNILVSSVNWLGDVIFSTPVYKALKDNYPAARVVALAVPRVEGILRLCPYVDDVIVFDEAGEHRPLLSKLAFMRSLSRQRFDAAFFLRPSRSRTFLAALAGIPVRVGPASKAWPSFLTNIVDGVDTQGLHRADVYLKIVEGFGVKVNDRQTALFLSDGARRAGNGFLEGRGLLKGEAYAVVNTGGNWDLKQWPLESFVELSRRITKEMKVKVFLPGSERDVERATRIAELSGVSPVVIAGATNLEALSAVFAGARFVVSADSGPLHLANALGAPTLAIFGPTRPEITGPRGSGKAVVVQKDVGCNRAPCYYLECPDNQCMKQVTVDDVFQGLQRL